MPEILRGKPCSEMTPEEWYQLGYRHGAEDAQEGYQRRNRGRYNYRRGYEDGWHEERGR